LHADPVFPTRRSSDLSFRYGSPPPREFGAVVGGRRKHLAANSRGRNQATVERVTSSSWRPSCEWPSSSWCAWLPSSLLSSLPSRSEEHTSELQSRENL